MTDRTSTGERKKRKPVVKKRSKPYDLHRSDISNYLDDMKKAGRTENTLTKYSYDLNRFYDFLEQGKQIYPDTLIRWKQSMMDAGYAPRTINTSVVAVNRFYEYIGCRDWQLFDWMELEEADSADLTREDYQRLLYEAKRQENIQLYLMIKILACTDLTPSELTLVTREAVNTGVITGRARGAEKETVLPALLREDLLDFAMQRGIRTGAIFLNGNKNPFNRTVVAKMIAALGEAAGLEPGQANPRNLRRLYLGTLADFQRQADEWVAKSFTQLLTDEEAQVGWRIWLRDQTGETAAV